MKKWRSEGTQIVVYLDDGIAIENEQYNALPNSKQVRKDLIKSGFVPNDTKSI